MDSKKITFAIDSNLRDVSLIGLSINKICSQIPLTDVEVYQIEACVVEAINNTIEHAYKHTTGNRVEVDVDLYLDRIAFKVCDTGQSMDPAITPSLDFDPDDLDKLPEGGMGLFIIHQVMDQVAYRTDKGKNILEMTKTFGAQPIMDGHQASTPTGPHPT
ncbi:ATP-binding protein [Desulfoluna spongiiphila]|uniref:Serine/threonine-protein kinase RsbW n=1 Tax=Desulfoluna spongiiphila TaxID=419481 RepID=A0A1G5B1U7_9BACT|nr:ATP-binding protein [Desulfoluna spongiiphila]SCX84133.1 serine/threonine-protein kinase RsbW [Desulfoluna spongiiphila]VVS92136.1 histidine kinase/hsp90-like atpase [Desulfoluna spongiiphila]